MKKKHSWEEMPDETMWAEDWATWGKRKENDEFIAGVMRGMDGSNIGLPNGLVKINQFIHGTHPGRYILIGADSGTGKTTLADFMYVYHLWRAARIRGRRIYIKYFSFEISAGEKKAKWVCQWIKAMYNVEVSVDYILGRIEGMLLQEEHLKMVVKAYSIVEEMIGSGDVQIIDNLLHPTGVLNQMVEKHYELIGKVHRDPGKTRKDGSIAPGMITGFTANEPDQITVAIIDHMALAAHEAGAMTAKQIMDKLSMYFVQLRNRFGALIVAIQQFSTNMMSAYREQKKTETAIAPQRLDFGDSTYTFRDADTVIGLVAPVQYNLKTYYGFDMTILGPHFIAQHLMKHRYGQAGKTIPLFANFASGMFYDMPTSPLDQNKDGQLIIDFYLGEADRLKNIKYGTTNKG